MWADYMFQLISNLIQNYMFSFLCQISLMDSALFEQNKNLSSAITGDWPKSASTLIVQCSPYPKKHYLFEGSHVWSTCLSDNNSGKKKTI